MYTNNKIISSFFHHFFIFSAKCEKDRHSWEGGKTNSKNGILFLKSFEIYVFLCPLLYVRTAASSFDQKTKKSGHVDVNNYLFFLEKEKKNHVGCNFFAAFFW